MNEPRPSSPSPAATPAPTACPVAAIDRSCRLPVLFLFVSGAAWLLAGSVLSLLASIHLHAPNFLSHRAALGYGRLQPASQEALLYGFCLPAAMGIGLWLFARLGSTPLVQPGLAIFGSAFWNLGCAFGIGGILAGDATGFAAFNLPGYAGGMLLAGYLLVSISAALTFHQRKVTTLFPSLWFLVAALFWFPWIFTSAQLFLVVAPVRGMAQAVIAWWYANNLQNVYLWLTGLAAVFYLLPKTTGNALYSRNLALLVFWLVLVFSSWGGIPASAPVPAWIPTLSLVATLVSLVTVFAVLTACRRTVRRPAAPVAPASLRFVRFGVASFVVAGLMQVVAAFPCVSAITDFTWYGAARTQINVFGFFAMVAFGAIYFIVPRVAGFECLCPKRTKAHFWLAAVGLVLTVVPEAVAGLNEGLKLGDANLSFLQISADSFHLMRVSTLGILSVVLGQAFFLVNLLTYVIGTSRKWVLAEASAATTDRLKTAGVNS